MCIDPLYSSSTVLSKKTWEKFEGPYLKRIADAIREAGAAVSIHNCGDGVYFEEVIKWSNPTAISVAHPAHGSKTWEEHAKIWEKKVITIGYSDSATTGLISHFKRWGIKYVFGIPGKPIIPLLMEIDKQGINFILNKHEGGSGYAASGYAMMNKIYLQSSIKVMLH